MRDVEDDAWKRRQERARESNSAAEAGAESRLSSLTETRACFWFAPLSTQPWGS